MLPPKGLVIVDYTVSFVARLYRRTLGGGLGCGLDAGGGSGPRRESGQKIDNLQQDDPEVDEGEFKFIFITTIMICSL